MIFWKCYISFFCTSESSEPYSWASVNLSHWGYISIVSNIAPAIFPTIWTTGISAICEYQTMPFFFPGLLFLYEYYLVFLLIIDYVLILLFEKNSNPKFVINQWTVGFDIGGFCCQIKTNKLVFLNFNFFMTMFYIGMSFFISRNMFYLVISIYKLENLFTKLFSIFISRSIQFLNTLIYFHPTKDNTNCPVPLNKITWKNLLTCIHNSKSNPSLRLNINIFANLLEKNVLVNYLLRWTNQILSNWKPELNK